MEMITAEIINSPDGINSRLQIAEGERLENRKPQTTENIQNGTGISKIIFLNKHSDWSP